MSLSELNIDWQAARLAETKRGKIKAVLVGIPGPLFWHRFRNSAARLDISRLGLTVKRVGPKQWEAWLWLNRHNLGDVGSELCEKFDLGTLFATANERTEAQVF